MNQATLAAAIALWGLLCFTLGRWCRSLAFVLVAAAPACAIVPMELVAVDRVDVIEINSFYDDHGRLVFDQQIFYDWRSCCERYEVRAWRLVKDRRQIPAYDHRRGEWRCLWQDGEIIRSVSARSIRRTWLQYDPEIIEREYLPKDRRNELRK